MGQDIAEKRLEDYNDVFADIYNVIIFQGEKVLHPDSLESVPTEAFTRNTDGSLRQGVRDICKADKKNGTFRLICGLENQSGIDNTMPERTMGYDFAAYEEQIRTIMEENRLHGKSAYTKRIHDGQYLAPVITVVLYFGTEEWKGPLTLHEMLEFPPELEKFIKPYVNDYSLNLVQVSKLPEEVQKRLTSDFRIIAEYISAGADKNKMRNFMKNLEFSHVVHPKEVLEMLSAISGEKGYREISEKFSGQEEKEKFVMIDIWNEIAEEGREEGRKAGREEGIKALIHMGENFHIPRNEIELCLQKEYHLNEEEAKEYLAEFWEAEDSGTSKNE